MSLLQLKAMELTAALRAQGMRAVLQAPGQETGIALGARFLRGSIESSCYIVKQEMLSYLMHGGGFIPTYLSVQVHPEGNCIRVRFMQSFEDNPLHNHP